MNTIIRSDNKPGRCEFHRKAVSRVFGFLSAAAGITLLLFGSPSASNAASGTKRAKAAHLQFQPRVGATPITVRNSKGVVLGTIQDPILLEFAVPPSLVTTSRTQDGIDIMRIFDAAKILESKSGQLIQFRAPYEFRTEEGFRIKPGTRVYFSRDEITASGQLRVSGARGGNENESEEFNRVLQDKGVIGIKDPAVAHEDRGHLKLPLTENNQTKSQVPDRFLSSPTCNCKKGSCYTTSYFGKRSTKRTTNGRTMSRYHQGMDVGGGVGTAIIASADGCVARKLTNKNAGYGLSLYLDHGNGFTTQYSHMKGFVPKARVNKCFKRGETIGYMGATGNCTGPHLHYGVYRNGVAVDPRKHMISHANASLSRACSDQPPVDVLAPVSLATTATHSDERAITNPKKTSAID